MILHNIGHSDQNAEHLANFDTNGNDGNIESLQQTYENVSIAYVWIGCITSLIGLVPSIYVFCSKDLRKQFT